MLTLVFNIHVAHVEGQRGVVIGPSETIPIVSNQLYSRNYVEPIPPLHDRFDIVRFILCWTGLATEVSSATCKL